MCVCVCIDRLTVQLSCDKNEHVAAACLPAWIKYAIKTFH